jgi:hypothetical protein
VEPPHIAVNRRRRRANTPALRAVAAVGIVARDNRDKKGGEGPMPDTPKRMPPPTIVRLLGRTLTLRDVENAFSAVNQLHPEYFCRATAEVRGDAIRIEGVILHRTRPRRLIQIGQFERHIVYEGGRTAARHDSIVIEAAAHREKRTAFYHYRKAFRFYMKAGIGYVKLMAADMGANRWPQFGFDLTTFKHKERLAKILRDGGTPATALGLTATQVARSASGRDPAGLDALSRLGELAGNLPMALDLTDPDTRAFLRSRGILSKS